VGGLKATAERRRMGIRVKTLSPIGDIASGIDMGVPTSIGTKPPFGDCIVFAFTPDILARRDVFFAPRDFGAGINRYQHFQQYAASIGQERIYHSPSPEARERHISCGIDSSSNEAYFKYEIPWSEVDMIILSLSDPGELERATCLIEEAKQCGQVPMEMQVVATESMDVTAIITERAELLANEAS
jgi:hypothetical protein